MIMAMIRPETEMKDSGIEYVGAIPKDWDLVRLRAYFGERKNKNKDGNETNLLSLSYGRIIRKNIDKTDGLLPASFNTYNIVEKNDIIIRPTDLQNDKRSLRTGLVTEHGIITSAYIDLMPIGNVDSRFVHYLLHSYDILKVFYNMGSGVRQGLNYSEFSKLKVPMPPLSEQQAIANYLDETCSKIDEIIAEAKASIDEYKNLRESLISNATTQGIKKNRCMKSSGVEWVLEIPSDWDMIPAKVLFSQSNERKHVDDVQLTASQKYGIISQVEYMKRENSRIVIATQGIENWKHVEPNDFIISLRSFQGGLEKSDVSGCITWHYVVLKANNGVYYDYFKWLFKSDKYINALQGTCNFIRNGQDLRFSNFVQVPLLVVPIEEQKEIADYLNKKVPKIDSLIAEKESLINDLEAYKKSLIYEVVTGKRRVV